MLVSLLHASSRLLAPGLGVKQQHGLTATGSQPSSRPRFAAAAVPARQSRSTETLEGGRAPKAAPAVLLTSLADSTSRGDAAFQSGSVADQHAVRAPGSSAIAAAAPGVRARRGRTAAAAPAVTSTAAHAQEGNPHPPSAPQPSKHRPKALPRRRKLKLPSPSAPDAPATVSLAVAGYASTDAPAAALPAAPATACVVPAASIGSSLPLQPPPPPPPPQPRIAAPSTPLLQDFLSGRGQLVKSVYRAAGLHELGLQQELSAAPPGAALVPPPKQPALPAPQQQQQLKVSLVLRCHSTGFIASSQIGCKPWRKLGVSVEFHPLWPSDDAALRLCRSGSVNHHRRMQPGAEASPAAGRRRLTLLAGGRGGHGLLRHVKRLTGGGWS